MATKHTKAAQASWNKGKTVGQKLPLKQAQVWAIRTRIELDGNERDLALFNLAIDSKLRACDLISLQVRDIAHGNSIQSRVILIQKKTATPVQFEITEPTRKVLSSWIASSGLGSDDFLFQSRIRASKHLSMRQYTRIVHKWVRSIGLDEMHYGTHTMRRTKATLIYRQTKNLRAVQLLLGHKKIESTIRYLGVEVEDALQISENLDL